MAHTMSAPPMSMFFLSIKIDGKRTRGGDGRGRNRLAARSRPTRRDQVEPTGGVVCFPRVRADVIADMDRFYEVLGAEHGTFVGEGHWFEADRHHFRLGFGWPTAEELEGGLDSLATMQLLLHLETAFGISLTPALVKRDHFATPAKVAELVNLASE